MGALIGIVALIGLGIAASLTTSEDVPVSLLRRRRRDLGDPIVTFHHVEVPFVNRRGKTLYRTQVVETPSEIRNQIEKKLGRAVSSEAIALATMIASEQPNDPPHVKAAIANAAVNYAHYKKITDVEDAITRGSGPQRSFGGQLGRYASTNEPPTLEDINIAEGVLDGRLRDTTGGAIQFDSPFVQMEGIRKGLPGYKRTPEQVSQDRRKAGLEEWFMPGVDPERLRFWRPRATA
jgi:hypothetical protein